MSATIDSSKRVRIRQAKPGEEYDIMPVPTGFILTRLVKAKAGRPHQAKKALPAEAFKNIDLDEPAFESSDKDESAY